MHKVYCAHSWILIIFKIGPISSSFQLTSCNWVKFMAAPNENRARHEFKFKIVRVRRVVDNRARYEFKFKIIKIKRGL